MRRSKWQERPSQSKIPAREDRPTKPSPSSPGAPSNPPNTKRENTGPPAWSIEEHAACGRLVSTLRLTPSLVSTLRPAGLRFRPFLERRYPRSGGEGSWWVSSAGGRRYLHTLADRLTSRPQGGVLKA